MAARADEPDRGDAPGDALVDAAPDEPPAPLIFELEPEGLPVTTAYRVANQVGGALVALLGAGLTMGGLSLGLENRGIPGPGVFPVLVGSLLAGLGVILFFLALAGKLDRSEDTTVPDKVGVRRILVTALATGVFLWALLWIGYPIAMTLYVFALLKFVGDRTMINSTIIALAFGIGSYLGFTIGLGLRLPSSALPFLQVLGL